MSLASSRLLAVALLVPGLAASSAPAAPCKAFSFSAPRQVEPGLKLVSPPLLGDFDGNGKPDLLVQTADAAFFIPGAGNGFGVARRVAVRTGGVLTAVGDFNGDGHLDALVQTHSTEPGRRYISLSILFGDGRGEFTQTAEVATPDLASIATGDFDGDGILDIAGFGAIPVNANGLVELLPGVWFLKGDGRGGFAAPVAAVTGLVGAPITIVAADFDRDGKLDLVLSTDGWHCGTVSFFRGNGRGGFGPREWSGVGPFLFAGDLNGDGIPDLMSGCTYSSGYLDISLATGSGSFLHVDSRRSALDLFGSGNHLVADFDGDGNADVLVSGPAWTRVLRGDGSGGLSPAQRVFSSSTAWHAVDLNGDGRPDLISVGADGVLETRTNDCAAGGPIETTLLLPVILSADGASGARYDTDLTVVNRGRATAFVDWKYTAFLGSGLPPYLSPVAAGEQRICASDPWSCLGARGPSPGPWGGTLRLTFSNLASADEAYALARIRSTTGDGRFGGVGFPAIPLSSALTGPSTIGWLRETEQDRSNIGLVNAGDDADGDVHLRVTVVSTDPLQPGTATLPDVSLPPGGFFQLDRILSTSGLGASSGFARVDRLGGRAPYYAWGVVNDNANADGSIVAPLAAGAFSGQRELVLPVLVEAGPFTSELVATNTSPVSKTIRLEWVSDPIALPDRTARFQVTLAPGEQLTVPSFVQWLRDRGIPGVGPWGAAFAGALFASVDSGDVDGLFLGARVASPGSAGRYGVFVPALAPSELAADSAWVYGLRQGSGNRTNLAIVNAGPADGGSAYFLVEIFDGATGTLAATVDAVRIEARGWLQLGAVLEEHAGGLSNGYARVTRTSGAGPFAAYAVVNDGDGPGLGTGDGTYLPMRVTPSR